MKDRFFTRKCILLTLSVLVLAVTGIAFSLRFLRPKTTLSTLSAVPENAVLKEIRFVSGPASGEEAAALSFLSQEAWAITDGYFYNMQSATEGALFEQYRDLFYEHPLKEESIEFEAPLMDSSAWAFFDSVKLIYYFDVPDEEMTYYVRIVFYEPYLCRFLGTDEETQVKPLLDKNPRPAYLETRRSSGISSKLLQSFRFKADESGALSIGEVNRLGGGKKL